MVKYAMDCEMVESGKKSILARVTIVNEYSRVVLDEYVKPTAPVSDYRTEYSGIRESMLKNGADFSTVKGKVRSLLEGHKLVGHSLQHDLEALDISFPRSDIKDLAKYSLFQRQYLRSDKPTQGRRGVAESPKNLQEQLRLPLEDKPGLRTPDRPNKLPAAPSRTKVEKIESMDTTRSSVHSCCPCDTARPEQPPSQRSTPKQPPSQSSTPKQPPSQRSTPKAAGKKCCRPPDNLPTRTTSKAFVDGSGDKK